MLDDKSLSSLVPESGLNGPSHGHRPWSVVIEARTWPLTFSCDGAGKWTRTTDQLLTKQLLCQLSYSGKVCIVANVV